MCVCACVRACVRAHIHVCADMCVILLQSTQLYWEPGVNWGSSPHINGYLVFTGETNAQLSLSHLTVLGSLWNFGFRDLNYDTWTILLALPQEDLPSQCSMVTRNPSAS